MLCSSRNLRVILDALLSHPLYLTYLEHAASPAFSIPQSQPPLSTSMAATLVEPTPSLVSLLMPLAQWLC